MYLDSLYLFLYCGYASHLYTYNVFHIYYILIFDVSKVCVVQITFIFGTMVQGVNKQMCHGSAAGGATSTHLAQYFAQRTLHAATFATMTFSPDQLMTFNSQFLLLHSSKLT